MNGDFSRSILHTSFPGLLLGFFVMIGVLAGVPARAASACNIAATLKNGHVARYQCSANVSETEALQYLAHQPNVTAVAPVQQYHLSLMPNDTNYDSQKMYLQQIKAPEAWDLLKPTSLRPVIAVLDSGVDVSNPDLAPNIWFNPWEVPGDHIDNDGNGYVDDQYGWDFVGNSPDPRPKFDDGWVEIAMQHGTIVSGVAAALGNNAAGVAGVSWNARIMPVRVLNGRGVGDTVTVARGIQYAVQNHADIINLSFVGSISDPILENAIDQAYRAGVLVVAAAGNEAAVGVDMNKQPEYPVCDDGWNGENKVIGVAAVDDKDMRAGFSNYGSHCIDLSAPGVRIYSTEFVDPAKPQLKSPYGGYWSGTSVAAPMVSGALALLKAAYPRLSPSQLRDILIASGDQIDVLNPGIQGGLGRRLNLLAALQLAGSARFPLKSPIVVAPQQGAAATVSVYDVSGEPLHSFLAYQPNFTKGVNVAVGDVDRDGQTDIVTVPRQGGGPHVKVFNTRGELQAQFMAFAESFRGGVSLAVADFTGDGKDDVAVATGRGGANLVRVYDHNGNLWYQFVPYDPAYTGGVNIAAGDFDGDGIPELVTAPAGSAKLPVRVFDRQGHKLAEFSPYATTFRGGVNLAVGDVDGDSVSDIITAPGAGGVPTLRVFTMRGKKMAEFSPYATTFRGGVNLAVGDVDGDGRNEIVTTPGASGGPHVRAFNVKGEVRTQFFVAPQKFTGGLTVAVFR